MRQHLGKFYLLFAGILLPLCPVTVLADTISVSQTITVTATVAPARSIVLNDEGQMTKIYSNTDQNIEPKVYVGDVPGEPRPLTAALLHQYNQIMSQQKDVVGVAIPVAAPLSYSSDISDVLMKTISSLTRPFSL